MEMKVNSKLIVQYRHQRAWSQQHLSMVAGVSLRTIQRIENEGNASFDTLKAIASAFDTEVNKITQKPSRIKAVHARLSASALVIGSVLLSIFITSSTTAATGIEIQAKTISQSKDKSETDFTGEVSMFIPHNEPFNIATVRRDAQSSNNFFQLRITAENATFLVRDAEITMAEEGVQIEVVQVTARNNGIPK